MARQSKRKKSGDNGRTGRSRKRRITPEDLLRCVWVADPQLSPDGSRILFTRKHVGEKNDYVTNLWIVDTDGGEPRAFTGGGRDAHGRWSPDGRRIAFIGARKRHRPQIFTISADGGEAVALTEFPEGRIESFKWSPDGRHLAAKVRSQDPDWTEQAKDKRKEDGSSDPPRVLDHWWYRLDGDGYFNAQRYALYLVDADHGSLKRLYRRDTLGSFTFDFSPDGRKIVIGTNRDRRALMKPWNDELLIVDVRSGRARVVPDLPRGPKEPVLWSPDGKWIAYGGHDSVDGSYSTENLELWICDPGKGGARSLTRRDDYCLNAATISDMGEVAFGPNVRWSPDSTRLYMDLGWHGEAHLASQRRAGGRITLHTSGSRMHSLGNFSHDGKLVAMTVGSATAPQEICVAKVDGGDLRPRQLTNFNGALMKELQLSRPKPRWVTAEDGTPVQAWVMMPPGAKSSRRYPAVLEIHGGPHAQYGVGFFHEFQVLAAAGYVVVFSNPRGSKGYGRDHCRAIRGHWGKADWQDIQAVHEFMKSQPFIRASAIGIMGGSYGGYMTNWAIGHTREFKAAITDRCVSNLVSMFGSSDFLDAPDLYWEGNAWDRPEARWNQSPLKHLGNAKTPTLIIHSEGDLRCNVEQAEQVFAALSVLNVPTRFVRYPRSASHGMSRSGPPDLRIHRLHQILDWWNRWL